MTPLAKTLDGLVIRAQSGFLVVRTDAGDYTCRLRGRLKKGEQEGDRVAVGDRVTITPHKDGGGVIESVHERTAELARVRTGLKREYRQILLANPDQIVIVFACAQPEPSLRMLDRFLVIAEKQQVEALIVANKVDLVSQAAARATFNLYADLGYPLVFTSARTGEGLDELGGALKGKLSALTGPSGVGKSSLLNAIQPNLGLQVSDVSDATSKGRHTTRVRQLFPLDLGGYVADTPGIRSLALWDTEPEELDAYFVEMRALVADCQFSDCTHTHEPGCAVLAAVEAGRVAPQRYQSYLRLRFGDETDEWIEDEDQDDLERTY
ncbi:MAG TPA: ribosome small subunit-dependent GTPase A [Brevefilum sp.]|nr:ribosome small subunit-dependent GTPase A [Brevefilum sp.]HOR18667.1 ribosome small subunit-dependent GTPase A [Brevefilum sp.]HPL68568.1 ribosome small subunit-dependent GTPase A [Brevefilum sp.]